MALGMRRLQVAFAGFLCHSAFRGSLGLPACDSARHGSACLPDNRYPDWNLIGLGVYLVVRQNVYLVRYPHCDHKRLKRRAVSPRCGDT